MLLFLSLLDLDSSTNSLDALKCGALKANQLHQSFAVNESKTQISDNKSE